MAKEKKKSKEQIKREEIEELVWLTNLRNKLFAEKGLKDLFHFNREIIEAGNKVRQRMIVPHVHGEWWKWYARVKQRLRLLLVPRHSLKSTFFTVGYPLQRIAKDRSVRILIANATLDNAKSFLAEIKEHLRHNEEFHDNYGQFYDEKLKWTEDEIIVSGRPAGVREPTVRAVGVGAGLAGTHWDLIVADDLVNEINSYTREQALKVIEWWRRAFSLLSPDGEMLVIGTRWTHYDLYQHVLDDPKLAPYRATMVRSVYNEDGTIYYPEMFTEDKLEELRLLEGSYMFSAFYLNDPVDEETALIKKSDIHYIGPCPCEKEHIMPDRKAMAWFAMCDPAVSELTQADESAIVVVGVDERMNWWVDSMQSGKWTVQELIARLFTTYLEYQPVTMSLEVISQSKALLNEVHEEEIRRNVFLPMKEITSRFGIPKEVRIRASLQPRFERGKVFIRRDMAELEDQLTRYPRSKRDDLLDCLADCSEIAFTPSGEMEDVHAPATIQERIDAQLKRLDGDGQFTDSILGEYY